MSVTDVTAVGSAITSSKKSKLNTKLILQNYLLTNTLKPKSARLPGPHVPLLAHVKFVKKLVMLTPTAMHN